MLKSYTKDKKAYTSDGATVSVTIPKIPASNTRFVKNKDTGLSMLYTYKDNKLISTDYFDVEEVTTEKQAKKKTPLAREYYYYVTRKVDDPHKNDGSKISKTYRFQFASYDSAWCIYENDTNELYRRIELPEGEENQDTTDIIPFWFDIFNTSYSKANKIFKKIISGEPDENKLYPLNDYFAFSWD